MPLAIASSALIEEGFDLIKTSEAAGKYKFPWVQLYVNSSIQDPDYLAGLTSELASSVAGIVIHLPNIDKLTEQDLHAVESLENSLPGQEIRVLIHYDESMTADNVPQVNGRKVGIENSKTGVFDPKHVNEALALAREVGSPFVFDIGRIMYADENNSSEEIISFVAGMLGRIDPDNDIIHVAGKSSWTKRFRDCSCALGSEEDIHLPIIPYLKEFSEKGGIIVFENEDMGETLDSVMAFRPQPY